MILLAYLATGALVATRLAPRVSAALDSMVHAGALDERAVGFGYWFLVFLTLMIWPIMLPALR